MKKALIALALAAPLAHADFFSGNDLYAKLLSSNPADKVTAVAYIAGVADGGQGNKHCIPDGVSVGQIVELTTNVLRSQPENRHFGASQFIEVVIFVDRKSTRLNSSHT